MSKIFPVYKRSETIKWGSVQETDKVMFTEILLN
jgi:hypothetical protein